MISVKNMYGEKNIRSVPLRLVKIVIAELMRRIIVSHRNGFYHLVSVSKEINYDITRGLNRISLPNTPKE